MRSPTILAALTLMATVPFQSGDGLPRAHPAPEAQPNATMGANSPEPGAALVGLGDSAPNFSYFAADGRPGRLRDLLIQGPVLLVFGADDASLSSLQRERETLVGLGVIPVAVTDLKPGGVRATAQRLGLTYPVIPDPRAIAATQFNTLDPATLHPLPGWFVLDRSGRVRALGRGAMPSRRWSEVSATALGLPSQDMPRPAHQPR